MKSATDLVAAISGRRDGRIIETGLDGLAATIGDLRIIASWGGGWDHVSASTAKRLPSYFEMKMVKRLFFKADETAVEYHVPATKHVNVHPNCLHLWRPQFELLPVPPVGFV